VSGRLCVVPNTLDFGTTPAPLSDALPAGVIARAATLRHWRVENARSARAFLKRVDALAPLAVPLQALDIVELPRPPKGGARPATDDTPAWAALLAPAHAGADVGLLSEAGLAAVADPGARLVAAAHAAGVPVDVWPGASAVTLALAASGLNGQRFAFEGYLPQDAAARERRIAALEQVSRREGCTQVAIETPYRNAALLQALVQTLHPATRLAVAVALASPDAACRSAPVAQWRREPLALPADRPAVFLFLAG
jgi:16S rRNA (cytidine1402-2'-O)-methyltransferase